MIVRKIAHLDASDLQKLKEAGEVLGAVAQAKASGEINELEEDTVMMLNALTDVINRVLKTTE